MLIQVWNGVSQRLLSLTLMGPTLRAGLINGTPPFFVSLNKHVSATTRKRKFRLRMNHASRHEDLMVLYYMEGAPQFGKGKIWQGSLVEGLSEK